MVILALDVGDRRIGIAVADARGRLASPVGAVVRRDTAQTRDAIANVVRERAVTRLLVGVPLGPNGEETGRAVSIREFADGLATALGLPVAFRDERNTTQDALTQSREATDLPEGRRRGARRPPSPTAREAARRRIDAMAAAVLLQGYLNEGISALGMSGERQAPHAPGFAPSDLSEALAEALLDAIEDAMPADRGASPRHGTGG